MFLEKRSRFIRLYEFRFKSRHKGGAELPLFASPGESSLLHALRKRVRNGKAQAVMSNNDVIELVKVEHDEQRKAIVLLFHRGSPDAADPTYRKRVKNQIITRTGEKEPEEEQSVSAHLIIRTVKKNGAYRVILEEIPGLSMGVVQPIIGQALHAYTYQYEDADGEAQDTYCVLKSVGIKSESVEDALKMGRMKFITLVRPFKADYIDEDDRLEPEDEKLRVKIKPGVVGSLNLFQNLIERAKADGWSEFKVDIDLGNDRSRQVPVSRDQDAKEVLFVKSEQVALENDMTVCTVEVRYDFVDAASKKLFV